MSQVKIKFIRDWLDKLVASDLQENDRKEVVYEQAMAVFKDFPHDEILLLMDKAAGKGKKRRVAAMFLLSFFIERPDVRERFVSLINDENRSVRQEVIRPLGVHKELVPLLAQVILNEQDQELLGTAIQCARNLKTEDCFLAILERAKNYPDEQPRWCMVVALTDYGDLRAKEYLDKVFHHKDQDNYIKDVAAWGLAKMKDKEALIYLIGRIDDDDGMFRAGQALCDIFKWEFNSNLDYILAHKQEWKIKLSMMGL